MRILKLQSLLFTVLSTSALAGLPAPAPQVATMPNIDVMSGDARWACEVHLCLANPNGARAVSECRPPINRLIRHLAKGGSFPHCAVVGDGNYINYIHDPFDPCEQFAGEGFTSTSPGYIAQKGGYYRYNFDGASYLKDHALFHSYHDKACVKNYLYTKRVYHNHDEDFPVRVFEKVVWQHPKPEQAFDVFIDGKLWHRARIY